jgi:hypothetical protein
MRSFMYGNLYYTVPFVPVPGLYRGGPAQGDRGGEGGHQETQVLPADQEGGGEQNTQGERRA